MFELMSIGAVIEIKPFRKGTEDFVASKFWMKDGVIWCSNPCFGTLPRPEITNASFADHLRTMVDEGFQVTASLPA